MPMQYLDIKFQNLFTNFVPIEMVLINKCWHSWQSSKWSGVHWGYPAKRALSAISKHGRWGGRALLAGYHRHNDVMTRKLMSTVDSSHKKSEMKVLLFSLMFYWMNCWTNIWNACNLKCHEAHVTSLSWFSETDISGSDLLAVVVYRLPGWCNIYS